ncbi:DUF2628 domain-containing protein [Emcibacter sp.]|uniref:DUF2628 domain-containing protein n=1 Tax=Emcibacter sp. TaxID=1979954 RepID=UPI002AA7F525|nr:DUF2628 domain-containing protein [Emcibacter sp.]
MSYKTYTAFVRPVSDPGENGIDLVVVPDEFSFGAMIFGPIWALFHQMWIIAGLLAILYIPLLFMVNFTGSGLLFLGLALLVGFEGLNLKGWSLEKKGYIATGIVGGDDEPMAMLRFYQLLAAKEISLPRFGPENAAPASHAPVSMESAGTPGK